MKIGILDDEAGSIHTLAGFLYRFSNEEKVPVEICSYATPEKFLAEYDGSFDLLFLDVKLPGKNGFATAKEIRKIDENVVIVFVTNMAKYAIRGYEVHAVDYILKPVTYSDFILKFKRAIRYVVTDKNKFYCVKAEEGIVNLPVSSIEYIEVFKNYLFIHMGETVHKVRAPLREAQEKLGKYDFVRIHNCYLVNMKHIQRIKDGFVWVGKDCLAISRNKKRDFMQAYFQYVGKM